MLQGESPPPLLHSLGFRQLRSGLLLLQTIFLQPADDVQTTCRRQAYVDPKWVLLVQSRPKWVLLVQSSTLLSLVHLGDGPLTRLSVPRTTHLARGVIPLPARDVGSLAIRLKTRTHRLRIANNGTINRTKRIIFVLPRWIF